MRKLILASHGSLAGGMLSAARMIIGACDDIETYDLDHYESPQQIYEILKTRLKDEDSDYIILCDINGGSVHNQLMQLMDQRNVYLVTGMSLSMVLELKLAQPSEDTLTLLKKVISSAKEHTMLYDHDSVWKQIKEETEEEELW